MQGGERGEGRKDEEEEKRMRMETRNLCWSSWCKQLCQAPRRPPILSPVGPFPVPNTGKHCALLLPKARRSDRNWEDREEETGVTEGSRARKWGPWEEAMS